MDGRLRIGAVAALVALAGCEPKSESKHETVPAAPSPAPAAKNIVPPSAPATPPAIERAAVAALPLDSRVERGEKPAMSPELLALGKETFARQCAACHGAKGEGDGPAAFAATPRPRNFTKGLFKLHSNENGMLPTDEDLFDTISRGMPGSAMPSFAHLGAKERWALVETVKDLTVTQIEDDDGTKEFRFFKERDVGKPLPSGDPVEASPEVLAIGKGVFLKLDCNKCHGPNGEADGPSAPGLKDDWGEPMWPRNFQDGRFRGGDSIRAIATRVNTGLGGTPMAAFGGGQLTDKERWALGHFVASLRKGAPKPIGVGESGIVASKSAQPIPDELRQPRFWVDAPVWSVALAGEGPKTARISVQRDAANVAVLVRWDDAIVGKDRAAAPEDFLDEIELKVKSSTGATEWSWKGEQAKAGSGLAEKGSTPALRGTATWHEGEWNVLFVHPAWTGTAEVEVEIADRSPSGKKESKSATFRISLP